MNVVISDTAEYGNYLFSQAAVPLLGEQLMPKLTTEVIGRGLKLNSGSVDNMTLVEVNEAIQNHPVEVIGKTLRAYMTNMKAIVTTGN
jgi:ketol-acid reductoisomerase